MIGFSVLISTCNQRIKDLKLISHPKVKYVVVHQVFYGFLVNDRVIQDLNARPDVIYKCIDVPGLSKSRNAALELCPTKYGYIMDDDVIFDLNKIEELIGFMEKDNVDIATCQYAFPDKLLSRDYSKVEFVHNILSVAKVCSIEICVNLESVKHSNIKFDQRFGLGSEFPSGEEYIFLTDALKKGLSVKYYPIVTSIHPDVTSGMDFYTNSSKTLAKRQMFKRIFGWKSTFYIFAFWLKKLPMVVKEGYGLAFTKSILLGVK